MVQNWFNMQPIVPSRTRNAFTPVLSASVFSDSKGICIANSQTRPVSPNPTEATLESVKSSQSSGPLLANPDLFVCKFAQLKWILCGRFSTQFLKLSAQVVRKYKWS